MDWWRAPVSVTGCRQSSVERKVMPVTLPENQTVKVQALHKMNGSFSRERSQTVTMIFHAGHSAKNRDNEVANFA